MFFNSVTKYIWLFSCMILEVFGGFHVHGTKNYQLLVTEYIWSDIVLLLDEVAVESKRMHQLVALSYYITPFAVHYQKIYYD